MSGAPISFARARSTGDRRLLDRHVQTATDLRRRDDVPLAFVKVQGFIERWSRRHRLTGRAENHASVDEDVRSENDVLRLLGHLDRFVAQT